MRLDWESSPLPPPVSGMRPPAKDLNDLSNSLLHRVTQGYRFRTRRRINLQEASVVKQEIITLADKTDVEVGQRRCFLNDSRVCVGAWGKGGTSSRRINELLRSCVKFLVGSRLSVNSVWTGAEANTADCPTRDLPLPKVQPLPSWLARVYSRSGIPTPFSQESLPAPLRSNPAAAPFTVQLAAGLFPPPVGDRLDPAASPIEVNRQNLWCDTTFHSLMSRAKCGSYGAAEYWFPDKSFGTDRAGESRSDAIPSRDASGIPEVWFTRAVDFVREWGALEDPFV